MTTFYRNADGAAIELATTNMNERKSPHNERNTMTTSNYTAPQTEDEQSEEDREALDQYDGRMD